ncbi:hypothetical protein Tco_1354033 [Tanacetum coccineum]
MELRRRVMQRIRRLPFRTPSRKSLRQRQLDVLHENSEVCGLTILQEPSEHHGQLAIYLGNPLLEFNNQVNH